MNENVSQVITLLAEKLGTTSEYLWAVLLRQAPISGVINLLIMLGWIAGTVFLLRLVYRKTKVPTATEGNRYQKAEWNEEGATIAWVLSIAVAIFVLLLVGIELTNTISAFINPEYWALRQIIK